MSYNLIIKELNLNVNIDKSWTLFLDRDGVINKKINNDYVKRQSEFYFLDGSLDAIAFLSNVFGKIFVVTNQRGVGKGVMSMTDLNLIHNKMLEEVENNNGRINKIYSCIEIHDSALCRKPNVGMGLQAKNDFPAIEFNRSVMIGDSISDILFGNSLGMISILINKNKLTNASVGQFYQTESLLNFTKTISEF